MPNNKSQLRLVSISVAAETADVCTRTIRRYIAQGRIHAYRVGPHLIKVDLDELLASFEPVGGGSS